MTIYQCMYTINFIIDDADDLQDAKRKVILDLYNDYGIHAIPADITTQIITD